MRSAGQVVSRDQITAVLFEREATPYDRFLDVHISHLRKKLQGGRKLIRTIRGVGYVFTGTARGLPAIPLNVSVLLAAGQHAVTLVSRLPSDCQPRAADGDYADLRQVDEMQLESARRALQRRGREALQDYFRASIACSMDRTFCSTHLESIWYRRRPIQHAPPPPADKCAHAPTDTGRSRIVRRTGSTGSPPRGNWVPHKSGPFFPTISS